MVLPRVPRTATVPEAAAGVVAGVVIRQEGLVVLVRLTEPPKEVEELPVRASGHPEAADAALGLGVAPCRPALAATKARLAQGQAVAGRATVRQDEVAAKAVAGPAARAVAPAAPAVLRPKEPLPPAGRRQAAADARPTTAFLLQPKATAAIPVTEAEGARPTAVIADILARRVAAAEPAPGVGRP